MTADTRPLPDGPGRFYAARACDDPGHQVVLEVVDIGDRWAVYYGEHEVEDEDGPLTWAADPGEPTTALRVPTAEEWVRALACRTATARAVAESNALAAELAAMRGEAAPEGWEWHKLVRDWAWCKRCGDFELTVFRGGAWHVERVPRRRLHGVVGSAGCLTGPGGAFEQAEQAAKGMS